MTGKGAGGDLDKVESEDQAIVEATQGVSNILHPWRYSQQRNREYIFHRILTKHRSLP